ncbi:hypothetical protein CEXT_83001 [Caerostris extrusa]|uniref:Uncharacterized protein n=1 Tax=Caerostris extrusa TaxID=172846 RepID=A0AAV4SGF7_CAEEX|nr:hypothetical protein CEXT_83001 [Caerostris extrusa]
MHCLQCSLWPSYSVIYCYESSLSLLRSTADARIFKLNTCGSHRRVRCEKMPGCRDGSVTVIYSSGYICCGSYNQMGLGLLGQRRGFRNRLFA